MMSEQEIDAVTTTTNKGNQTLKEIRRNDINSDETGTLKYFSHSDKEYGIILY